MAKILFDKVKNWRADITHEFSSPQLFLAPGTHFVEKNFPTGQGGAGVVWDDSRTLHLLGTLFLIQCYH